MSTQVMSSNEKTAAFSLSAIFAVRMLGLFMILPVFSLYAVHLQFVTPTLIGLAMGIYGLTQAICQIPFGTWSDRVGRKPIILLGFLLFITGSIIAAMAHSIYGVIVGRALQGAGAVGSTVIALLADLTREEHRTKAMAVIGSTIGVTFSASMVLGPILNAWMGVSGIFWLTAALGIGAMIITLLWVPTPIQSSFHRDAQPLLRLFKSLIKDVELLRLDLGIFISHAILTASFVVIPIALLHEAHLIESKQWHVYLPALLLAFISMVPLIIIGEKRRKLKPCFLLSITLLIISELILWRGFHSAFLIGLSLYIFFTAFSFLEAALPSLISKQAPVGSKGTAMGIYSSAQFLGIFLGGYLGGFLYEHGNLPAVFITCAMLASVWLVIAISMRNPKYLTTHMLNIGTIAAGEAELLTRKIAAIPGVAEAIIVAQEGIAYVKLDSAKISVERLREVIPLTNKF